MKEKMNRSRKSKSFHYKRVELPHDQDFTDSEDDLGRFLGPSSNPSMQLNSNKTWKEKNKCGIYCCLLMHLLTFTIFSGLVIFATIKYPGGIQEALTRAKIFNFDRKYGTTYIAFWC